MVYFAFSSTLSMDEIIPSETSSFTPTTRQKQLTETINKKKTPWSLVRERTIPTEQPPLVDEI
jgi:hypothetical protein